MRSLINSAKRLHQSPDSLNRSKTLNGVKSSEAATKMLRSSAFGLAGFLLFSTLSSCGMIDNPYKSRAKKCKVNCEPKSSDLTGDEPRNSPAFDFNVVALSDKTIRSAISTTTDKNGDNPLLSLISRTPAFYTRPLLESTATSVAQANQLVAKIANNDPDLGGLSVDAKCVEAAFSKAPTTEGSAKMYVADYGRCVLLKKKTQLFLADKTNASRYKGAGYLENEGGFLFVAEGDVSMKDGSDVVAGAANALELGKVFPFRSLAAKDLTEGSVAKIKLHVSNGDVSRLVVQRQSGEYSDQRVWEMKTLGTNPQKKLELELSPAAGTLILNGSVNFLKGIALNPLKDDEFVGDTSKGGANSGLSVEYIFSNFVITHPNLVLDGNLGFTNDAVYEGSYYMRLNAVPNGDPQELEGTANDTFVFRFEGQRKACELKLFAVKDVTNRKITEKLVGLVDVCKNQVAFVTQDEPATPSL